MRENYSGITQTIWGTFEAYDGNSLAARLEAVDSTLWEFESYSADFLEYVSNNFEKFVLKDA